MSKRTEILVKSVQRPSNTRGTNWIHDYWSIKINGESTGTQYNYKEKAKEQARTLAKENRPAVIKFHNRDAEVFREEMVEE